MNTKPIRTGWRAALVAVVFGAGPYSAADEVPDDLQAGIDAFNRGDLPGAMTPLRRWQRPDSLGPQRAPGFHAKP